MGEIRIEFHRLAEKEFEDAYHWYAARSPESAVRFTNAVNDAILRITSGPELLSVYSGHYRWVRVIGFPYLLVFRARSITEMVVVAVAHTSRRPGYWQRRK
ncbi:MAG: type II toxin-antitoxin system RelE/ParE family toxin [Pirellulales bacterium]|nr:type II toxin-antitoxin system RelE/ParE family toxin [Pirellulales bacterium]